MIEWLLLAGAILAGPVNHIRQNRKIKRCDREIAENNAEIRRRLSGR